MQVGSNVVWRLLGRINFLKYAKWLQHILDTMIIRMLLNFECKTFSLFKAEESNGRQGEIDDAKNFITLDKNLNKLETKWVSSPLLIQPRRRH